MKERIIKSEQDKGEEAIKQLIPFIVSAIEMVALETECLPEEILGALIDVFHKREIP